MTPAPELLAAALILVSSTWIGCCHSPEPTTPAVDHDGEHAAPAPTPVEGHHQGHDPKPEDHHGGHAGEHNPENVKTHVDQVFSELDANGDRAISRDEAKEHRIAAKFDQIDADADGAVSYDEMTAFGTKMHAGDTPPH